MKQQLSHLNHSTLIPQLTDQTDSEAMAHPTSLKLLKELSLNSHCATVRHHEGRVYAGLLDGSLVRIASDFETASLLNLSNGLSGGVGGIAFCGNLMVTTTGLCETKTVGVHELSTCKLVKTWSHNDSEKLGNNLAVVNGQVVVVDRKDKRLSVYTIDGELVKHIPCQQIVEHYVSLCSADHDSVILSNNLSSSVYKVSISKGQIEWESTVGLPLSVACYKDKYCVVNSEGSFNSITILDINTGELSDVVLPAG